MSQTETPRPAFGTAFADSMAVASFRHGHWGELKIEPTAPIALHPAAHVLHYASTCFEGFKAYRWQDGSINVFRMERHIDRMRQSARGLRLPEPDPELLEKMVRAVVDACRDQVPGAPGALYLRPMLFGTLQNIGAAAAPSSEAMLIVLASPVWDYFAGGMRPLKILVDDVNMRTTSHLGSVKTGGNYAAALGPTLDAKQRYGIDQVLFCPGGQVQETGAANFLLLDDNRVLTRSLDTTFLHGVTRDSVLTIARDLDYEVTERPFDVSEMLDWVKHGEAALSGTAAVLAGVGTLVYRGDEIRVGDGGVGANTQKLRAALVAVQRGEAPDRHNWLTRL
jgi:branched-chain amino acid aminotransferase